MSNIVAYQGEPGANSDLACRKVLPGWTTLPCASFEEAFAAVAEGRAQRAMIPVENSIAGRVADVHHLLPRGGLHIIGEHFQAVHHCILGLPGTKLSELREVHSHVQALGQCRETLRKLGVKPVVHADTAGAAADVAKRGDKTIGAIASELAAEIYGLDILQKNAEDVAHNTTRFLVMQVDPAAQPPLPSAGGDAVMTSFLFRVRSIPAALYKALGGFATNGVNLVKLESYMVDGKFQAAQFYVDAEGHPNERNFALALDELRFFAEEVKVLGTYPASPFRRSESQR
ncbi:prephenate dehydratase [Roseiterribacter gracilis]|uniref:prephenate dehydratase n=1 Tax=Roseiterribacter gracilis TaxID=2812848 RepID=A0A8S8XDM6_9PROT|nr:prephenate dehydratase [Rhodospirillales bacterium TMPK1]